MTENLKSYLFSIRPQWLAKILNGEKTEEIRLHAPKPPFIAYGYCTKGKPYLWQAPKHYTCKCYLDDRSHNIFDKAFNGKVVCKFLVEEVDKLSYEIVEEQKEDYDIGNYIDGDLFAINCCFDEEKVCKESCLSSLELAKYLCADISSPNMKRIDKAIGYSLHITNLEGFDKPMELSDFVTPCRYFDDGNCKGYHKNVCPHQIFDCNQDGSINEVTCQEQWKLTKAPQSWQKVEVRK